MSNEYKAVAKNIVNELWNVIVDESWDINHSQHREVIEDNLSRILIKNIPEIELVSLSSSEIKDFIFYRNIIDISQIMELSSQDFWLEQIIEELDLSLKLMHSLIVKNNPEGAKILMIKLNDANRYSVVLSQVYNFHAKAKKINSLVTKILNIIQHAENSKELGIQTSNPSFSAVFTKMASNPRFNEELSLYLKSLSN